MFKASSAFFLQFPCSRANPSSNRRKPSALGVSELHIPGYVQSKLPFILTDEDLETVLTPLETRQYSQNDYESLIPYQNGHLLHKTKNQVLNTDECQRIVKEAEDVASRMGWTTSRHGNYPTTEIPLVELPETLQFLKQALVERIYPLLTAQFGEFLPDASKLRVADGFIVKYDAEGGQTELKPHRDGSVLSFNVALNPANEFDGGGTWFESLGDAIQIDEGQVVSHASGVFHGGNGKRYILVAFVILEGYDSWSMRFYNQVRNL